MEFDGSKCYQIQSLDGAMSAQINGGGRGSAGRYCMFRPLTKNAKQGFLIVPEGEGEEVYIRPLVGCSTYLSAVADDEQVLFQPFQGDDSQKWMFEEAGEGR